MSQVVKQARTVYYVSPGGLTARGGMGGVARYLTEAFKQQRPELVCKVLDPYGSKLSWWTPLHFLNVAALLCVSGIAQKVDVVHLHMSHGGSVTRKLWLLRVALLVRIPAVIHLHGSKFQTYCDGLPLKRRHKIGRMLGRAGRVVVIGEFWKNYLVTSLHVPPDKVAVIYNGVPLNEPIQPRPIRQAVRILAAGLIGKRKGTGDLIQALAAPEMAGLAWHATLAGNGEVDVYRKEAESLGLEGRVDFPGWVDPSAIPALLKEADIFVLPSYNEGLPVAILEAMMASLPVVTTPVGAILELVVPEVTAKVVPAGSVKELTDALVALVVSPELRCRFGQAGRQRVEEQFTIETIAQQMITVYDQLTKRSA